MQLKSKQLQGEEEGHKYQVGDVFSFKNIFTNRGQNVTQNIADDVFG